MKTTFCLVAWRLFGGLARLHEATQDDAHLRNSQINSSTTKLLPQCWQSNHKQQGKKAKTQANLQIGND